MRRRHRRYPNVRVTKVENMKLREKRTHCSDLRTRRGEKASSSMDEGWPFVGDGGSGGRSPELKKVTVGLVFYLCEGRESGFK